MHYGDDYLPMSATQPLRSRRALTRGPRITTASTSAVSRENAVGQVARWRRRLTWALGLVWLLDAALQYQPYMFSTDFPNDTIKPSGAGSPLWVQAPVTWSAHLMAHHIVIWNSLFATVQLLIAVGLFVPRLVRPALAGSIVWAVMVWWLGEGLGGSLAGAQSPVMGFPGAVVIYAVIAVLLWPPADAVDPNSTDELSVAGSSLLRRLGSRLVWLALWVSFAWEALEPVNRAPSALHDMLTGMTPGEPAWLKSIDNVAARLVGDRGTEFSIALAIVFAVIAVAIFVPALFRPGLILAVILAAMIWIFAQNLGEIATGEATDPNSAPLLALLALCFWPLRVGAIAARGHRDE
jgi:hypothetical protein